MNPRVRTIKYVSVYWPGEAVASHAITESEASQFIVQGLAVRVSRRGQAIRMKHKPVSLEIRGVSCKPNERLMEKFVDGVPLAIPAIECWRFRPLVQSVYL